MTEIRKEVGRVVNAAEQRERARLARLILGAGLAAVPLVLSGCAADSFLDPSKVGRWEQTPITTPILDRLVAIEGPQGGQAVETSSVRADDLIPEPESYRMGPGDQVEIRITDYEGEGKEGLFPREVDPQGYLQLREGRILVEGLPVEDVQVLIADKVSASGILTKPQVQVTVTARRRSTFNVLGAVNNPGLFSIPRPDYRLLEALTASGRFSETVQNVYIIRQIPLNPKYIYGPSGSRAPTPGGPAPQTPAGTNPETPKSKDNLNELIDELTKPPAGPDKNKQPMPVVMPGGAVRWQPEVPPIKSPTPPPAEPQGDKREPIVDLTPSEPKAEPKPGEPKQPEPATDTGKGAAKPATQPAIAEPEKFWVFKDGKWVQVSRMGIPKPVETAADGSKPTTSATPPTPPVFQQGVPGVPQPGPKLNPETTNYNPAPPSVPNAGLLVTQRVIEVPLAPLLAGSAQFNVIIRPGDVLRIPSAPEGLFYMSGEVVRPGPYSLPSTGIMTLKRAIISAGGFGNLAIPERTDLTRRIGPDRQATIMVDLRAIYEGTQPDIALKNDDIINVGTNFWAFPLAVFRGGLRASYGFGFILDRNFQGEVFGADQSQVR